MKAVITVIGQDRTGIIAKVTTLLAEAEVNIDDINQTIMQGLFTMVMLVELDHLNMSFEVLQSKLESCGKALGTEIRMQRADIFTAMHQI